MKLSHEEESFLLEERAECFGKIKELYKELHRTITVKNILENKIINLKIQHNEADRKLALANKLTVITKASKKSKEESSMEALLKDPAKIAELIGLLEGARDVE